MGQSKLYNLETSFEKMDLSGKLVGNFIKDGLHPEINPSLCGQLIYDEEAKIYNGIKMIYQ